MNRSPLGTYQRSPLGVRYGGGSTEPPPPSGTVVYYFESLPFTKVLAARKNPDLESHIRQFDYQGMYTTNFTDTHNHFGSLIVNVGGDASTLFFRAPLKYDSVIRLGDPGAGDYVHDGICLKSGYEVAIKYDGTRLRGLRKHTDRNLHILPNNEKDSYFKATYHAARFVVNTPQRYVTNSNTYDPLKEFGPLLYDTDLTNGRRVYSYYLVRRVVGRVITSQSSTLIELVDALSSNTGLLVRPTHYPTGDGFPATYYIWGNSDDSGFSPHVSGLGDDSMGVNILHVADDDAASPVKYGYLYVPDLPWVDTTPPGIPVTPPIRALVSLSTFGFHSYIQNHNQTIHTTDTGIHDYALNGFATVNGTDIVSTTQPFNYGDPLL